MSRQANLNLKVTSVHIPGLVLLEEVGRGAQGIVFKALIQDRPVAVKVSTHKSSAFKREAVILGRIHHPSIPQIIEVGETSEFSYFVMEFISGHSLAEEIKKGPLKESQVIELAKSLASGLIEVNRRGLVHGDLKPANILLSKESSQPKLIDFGFAMKAHLETKSDQIVGTFLYSPPEQTGMLNRPIDGRTDLYALGVTLFECLTGHPPFQNENAAELIRQHAVAPIPQAHEANSQVSPLLSALVAKLMAKDPDDRYQTALSLLADLENLQQLKIENLGLKNKSLSAAYESPLIGRENEMTLLQHALDQSLSNNQMSLVLIEGAPGAGKSRLVKALIEKAESHQLRLLQSKCHISESVPLAVIRRLLESHLRQIQSLPEEMRETQKRQVREAAGEYSPLLKNFSPHLSEILGEVASLSGTQFGQEQYHDALSHLFSGLVTCGMFSGFAIDDIQWLDEGSRQVLKKLFIRLKSHPSLIICTSRNDIQNAQDLQHFRETNQSVASQTHVVKLALLDASATSRLVSYHLGEKIFDHRLAQKLYELSGGSPFALNEYLQAMFEADCLSPSGTSWVVDFQKLEKLNLPQDVIQLVLQRIDSLSARLKEILGLAALCGSRLDTRLLSAICEWPDSEIESELLSALKSHLIERSTSGGYRFVHDRVREAFLERTKDPSERQNLYLKIALQFERLTSENRNISDIYSLARYYSASQWEQNRNQAFSANLEAGLTAMKDFANMEAREFLEFSLSLTERISGVDLQDLLVLHESLAETYFRLAQLEEAFEHFHNSLEYCSDPLRRAQIRCRMSMVRLTTQKVIPATEELNRAFLELEFRLPTSSFQKILFGLWYALLAFVSKTTGWTFGQAKGDALERHRTLAQLTSYSTQIYYYHNDIPGIFFVALKSLHHVHQIGSSPELVSSYIFMACLSGVLKLRRLLDFFSNGAISTSTQLADPLLLAQSHMMKAISVNFTGRVLEAEELSQRALIGHQAWLPVLEWLIGAGDYITSLLYRGYNQNVIQWGEKAFERIENMGEQAILVRTHGAYPIIAAGLTVQGQTAKAEEILKDFRSRIDSTPSESFLWNTYLSSLMIHCMEQNQLGESLDWAIEKQKSFKLNPLTCLFHFRQIFITQAYTRLAQYEAAEEHTKSFRLQQLKEAYRELLLSANVPLYKGHRYVIQAALARIQGHFGKAQACLFRAEKLALQTDSRWMLFEISKQKALLLLAQKQNSQALLQAQTAFHMARDFGWIQRRENIRQLFNLAESSKAQSVSDLSLSPVLSERQGSRTIENLTYQRHRDSLMQLGLALSKTFDPEEQIRIALKEIVQLLNGERAFLFLRNSDFKLHLKLGISSEGIELANLSGFSRTIVDRVHTNQEAVVLSGSDDGEVLASESIVAHNLRSILAVPLMMRSSILGVVYLDSRIARGLFSQQDVEILTALANHIAVALETAKSAQLMLHRKSLEMDLKLAGIAQSLLLPPNDSFGSEMVRGVASYQSASQTGGDWWHHHFDLNGHRMVVADVTGHGAGAAIVSAAAIGVYKTLLQSHSNQSLDQILGRLNTSFRDLVRDQYSMTLFALEISKDGKSMKAWSAGCPQVILLKANGETVSLMRNSTPFGYEEFQMGEWSQPLEPRDRIFIYTDGVYEFKPGQGSSWSERRLIRLLESTRDLSLMEARSHLLEKMAKLQGGQSPDDDMTFLIIEISENS